MREFERPTIFVSRCIEHKACRYDGSIIGSAFIKKIKPHVNIITECPEVAIGLSIPRQAIRIIMEDDVEKLVYSMTGEDVSEDMINFSATFLSDLKNKNIHGAVLKSRSPSCGIKDVKMYKGTGRVSSLTKKTKGFFGKAFLEAFPELAVEDEGRISNYQIREHFLTRIYTMAAFDKVKASQSMKSLVKFQSDNKYLLMAYHQANQKVLGKIVANHEHKPVKEVMEAYEEVLYKSFMNPMRQGRNMNMLLHLFGYFSKELNKDEKAFFLDRMEDYQNHKIPYSVPLSIIHSWAIRFDNPYLKDQTIFEAYPKVLIDVNDSGKGVDK
ncbi:conserved protein of unknown function [Petrocella atlantisensis]|uniref:DUF1722 domain-containing protein n=1 Tax=Petrocella atlantisensis TaxID=2173034 RepID=A0A3P7PYI1_9FIRM|nr:DUF523 and DUF1722 domain-containing protein [Petrocella atlantisensis]MCF8020852.1 DUF523 and DUF1722 domain-containing protein [Vallitaleaceae bacterium]VDN48201.1 conserved protein of unknown function [Petrocella atlantisensis]